ncbi:MAG: nucleoside triphosphate pyrophosphohydrolase [Anaerolineaceae bacterium]|nr:MAG: nucleoside triphosphate pyrophosphohydrolase [Anaerolineaceae bacterium]
MGMITVVGLGPGDPESLTRKAWEVLSNAAEVYLRTGEHPVIKGLPHGVKVNTFDHLYSELDDFEAVYQAIVTKIIELADRPEGVVYAVPGDPTVAEATVLALRQEADELGLSLRIVQGVSFIEACLAMLGIDALDGLYIADALELAGGHHPPFSPDSPVLIGQLYSSMVAADVKLTLMNQYPDDHPVQLIHAAGTSEAEIEALRLHQIDQSSKISNLTALYVPQLPRESAFESFQETVAHLRAPDGCPWDRKQTHKTLRTHLLEESYEALQAIDADDMTALREELGDLLLQIVLHAQIATEEGEFSMADVIASIQEKIVRRHPHVFGGLHLDDMEHVLHNWEALKAAEREGEGEGKGLLDGVPLGLPALSQAAEIQERVKRVGFDWPEVEGVLAKIIEELEEVGRAPDSATRTAEMGDVFFSVVNYARWLGVDPEAALREANLRFRRRFGQLEEAARAEGRDLSGMSLEEMDALWDATKDNEG